MVQCQWYQWCRLLNLLCSLVLSWHFGLTRSNSGLFSTPGFIVSPSDLSMSSIFGVQSSYMLEYHWLFTLFLRSAGCLTGAEGKWTLAAIFRLNQSNFLKIGVYIRYLRNTARIGMKIFTLYFLEVSGLYSFLKNNMYLHIFLQNNITFAVRKNLLNEVIL